MKLLEEALVRLLERRSLGQISIRDITEAAGLSYQTFFRRVGSKDELFIQFVGPKISKLLRHANEALAGGNPATWDKTWACIRMDRELWTILLNGGGASATRAEFTRISHEIARTEVRMETSLPVGLVVPLLASVTFEIFAWWVRQAGEYPVEGINKHLNAFAIELQVPA
jgi:AcrR family transcriptional regulator